MDFRGKPGESVEKTVWPVDKAVEKGEKTKIPQQAAPKGGTFL